MRRRAAPAISRLAEAGSAYNGESFQLNGNNSYSGGTLLIDNTSNHANRLNNSGTVVLAGAALYTGATGIQAGTLLVAGALLVRTLVRRKR